MITVKKLQKVYENGYEALQSIDLEIPNGELVCLLGPSGCGKSTMLNLIAGLLDPTSGDILFDGESVIHMPPKDRSVGMVFQNYALYPHMTVLENVTFPLRVGSHKKTKEEAVRRAKELMKLTDIEDLWEKKPGALSGGQQQRVAITRALIQDPKVLLLDEPLSNLDARLRLKIREEIRRLVKKIGITTIFVTHDQEEALSISDRIALMNDGVIQQYDVPQQLYLEPGNLFVAQFIGSPIINTFSAHRDGENLVCQNLVLPLSSFDSQRWKLSECPGEVTVGIRPEHFQVSENGTLPVSIESVEMIGRYAILHFDLANQPCRCLVESSFEGRAGDPIRLDVDYSSTYLFDAEGKRVY